MTTASAVSSSLMVTLQRQLAARDVYLPSTVCEQIVAAQLDGIATIAIEASKACAGPKLRLVETERGQAS